MTQLFMIQLLVADLEAAVRWYSDCFELKPVIRDPAGRFVMMEGAQKRVAFKEGQANPGTTTLYFLTDNLAEEVRRLSAKSVEVEGEVQMSAEGYRSVFVQDPDGHRIGIFEWLRSTHPGLASP